MLPTIDVLNEMPEGQATDALQQLFEHAPGLVRRLTDERPFASYEELIDRAEDLAAALAESEQVEVINGHPRIGADPASISSQSYREQGYDRAAAPGDEELADRLASLNEEYERRFGFRCCVFVAGRTRAEIAELMADRLSAEREEELQRALSDVFAIARSRLLKLTHPEEEAR